jgi:LmbE family N-acetylglucosaminyl deacetylase
MKVLVVAAHPDDEILGVGGTVRKHALAGDEVRLLVACEGVSMRYEDEHRQSVVRQAREAGAILGAAEVLFGELPDQRLDTLPRVEINSKIEDVVRAVRPDVIYTHFGGDVNHDHGILFQAVQVATRPYSAPFVREVLAFETPSSTEWGTPAVQGSFVPHVFVDVSAMLEDKIRAFCCYEREVRPAPHPRSPESLRARARTWGSVIGVEAAEPFMVIRAVR